MVAGLEQLKVGNPERVMRLVELKAEDLVPGTLVSGFSNETDLDTFIKTAKELIRPSKFDSVGVTKVWERFEDLSILLGRQKSHDIGFRGGTANISAVVLSPEGEFIIKGREDPLHIITVGVDRDYVSTGGRFVITEHTVCSLHLNRHYSILPDRSHPYLKMTTKLVNKEEIQKAIKQLTKQSAKRARLGEEPDLQTTLDGLDATRIFDPMWRMKSPQYWEKLRREQEPGRK